MTTNTDNQGQYAQPLQTILGAGGPVGVELAKALAQYTDNIRLVSRNPKAVNPTDQLWPTDLSQPGQIREAVRGSAIVFVTIGFAYTAKNWANVWPPFMEATIDACLAEGAKLVFIDNVYMYEPSAVPHMTESSPIGPKSKKGKVRAELVQMIQTAMKSKGLQAIIARSADFYGPVPQTSVFVESITKNMKAGKKAQWFASADKRHNFTNTVDAGRATALLGNTPDVYGRTWHLPTDPNQITANEWVNLVAKLHGGNTGVQVLPTWMMPILGLFIPILSEFYEMVYQYDQDYFFDSSAFAKRFPDFKITSKEESIKQSWDIA
jgi:nucleoside-diphosphate-sugar epimerase